MSARGPIALAERVIALFAEGSFSATYKHALLLALLDLCFEKTSQTGVPPTSVTTRQVAEQVLALYWPQCVPWKSGRYLRQGGGANQQAEVLSRIIDLRNTLRRKDSQPLSAVRVEAPQALERLLRFIEWKLIEMPIPRLQVLGGRESRFLYEYQWDKSIRAKEISDYQDGKPGFSNNLQLQPGVAEGLIALNGLLRPLIRREWLRLIQQMNNEPEALLEQFLFDRERAALAVVRGPLMEVQSGRCFFCATRLTTASEVDHFIPWSRFPNNAMENLVVAHPRCNNDKRDFLASATHIEHWASHVSTHAADLSLIARRTTFETARARSQGIAAATYLRLPQGAMLWLQCSEFVELDRPAIELALRAA